VFADNGETDKQDLRVKFEPASYIRPKQRLPYEVDTYSVIQLIKNLLAVAKGTLSHPVFAEIPPEDVSFILFLF
jgi:hypothetical protein